MSEKKFDASTGLTCISCRLVFANFDIQRDHYRTEWHRYNVKRQVAELPPISQEDFNTRLKLFNDEKSAAPTSGGSYCAVCRKPFQSQKAYENHVNSKRHQERVDALTPNDDGTKTAENRDEESSVVDETKPVVAPLPPSDFPIEEDEGDSDDSGSTGWRTVHSGDEGHYDESEAISNTSCLFCSVPSSSLANNLQHMTQKHGFSVPDHQYCVDIDGLIKYLGMKIGCGNECIACNRNVKAFCNRDACQKHMRDRSHCWLNINGEMVLEYMDFYDYSELLADDNENESLIDDGAFLILPSGARIGHRSLARYFRQSLNTEGAESASRNRLHQKLISNGHIKALGWGEMSRSLAVQRARDMKYLKRAVDTYRLKQGLKSNKLFKTRGRKDQQ